MVPQLRLIGFKVNPLCADVQTLELRFPRSKVPTAETTYACYVFDVPADQPYHLVAFEPIIDNPNVMHHMVAMVCDDTGRKEVLHLVCDERGRAVGSPGV